MHGPTWTDRCEIEEETKKVDEGETFFFFAYHQIIEGLENSSSTGHGPSRTWVATNTKSQHLKSLHDVIIICSVEA